MKNEPSRAMATRRAFALGAAVLALAGCADMTGVAPAQARLRDAASLGLTDAAAQPVLSAEWWREFGDPQLDALIDRALEDNPSLRLAQARLERARALSEGARSALRPKLGAELDLNRQLFTSNFIYPPPLGGSIFNSGQAQLEGSWEIDFFGKNRAALNAALGNTRAAEADAQAARVLLASNVSRGYFELARLHDQLAVAERTLAQREQVLGLVRDRFSAGLDTRLELSESEGGLPGARRQIEALSEQVTLERNALGALVGQPDAAKTLTPPALDTMNSVALAQAIPADLLGRRADVAAARWRVEAARQDVKSAERQFYPNVNLIALAGFSSLGFGNLFKSGSEQWNVGPAITLPIFEGGRLRANLHGRNADLDAAVESYNATVLDAVRDAADQIASLQSIARQQTQQQAAQAAAESAYDLSLQRYKAGLGTYLNVLTAESTVLAQRRLEVDLRARALDTKVALIRALGGGYPAEAVAQAGPNPAHERVASRP
jgi:NodT family efflux transporter outer membrane factor (OMF) lipoprotein